jgi:hypothetical protein
MSQPHIDTCPYVSKNAGEVSLRIESIDIRVEEVEATRFGDTHRTFVPGETVFVAHMEDGTEKEVSREEAQAFIDEQRLRAPAESLDL